MCCLPQHEERLLKGRVVGEVEGDLVTTWLLELSRPNALSASACPVLIYSLLALCVYPSLSPCGYVMCVAPVCLLQLGQHRVHVHACTCTCTGKLQCT